MPPALDASAVRAELNEQDVQFAILKLVSDRQDSLLVEIESKALLSLEGDDGRPWNRRLLVRTLGEIVALSRLRGIDDQSEDWSEAG